MKITTAMKLLEIKSKKIENASGSGTVFKSAYLLDKEGNTFEVTLDKKAACYAEEGTIEKDGTATLDIFVEDKAKTSKSGNPYIAKVLKMRCLDFQSK